MARILVLGVGNSIMADDGIGPVTIAKLHEMGFPDLGESGGPNGALLSGIIKKEIPETVIEAMDAGTSALSATYRMDGFDYAVMVDAVDFGGSPGDIATFDPDEVESAKEGMMSIHDFDIIKTLQMLRQLDELPVKSVKVVAVQPEEVCHTEGLTPTVAEVVDHVVETTLEMVAELARGG